ncbi:hypothetical protein AB0G02_06720 [Actinosynnema sp. NPDC023658]|uniref:hypothetical protein n=1 Tax=Actinosynnema sp. NPDC023658 TaxID=3155465 RepID=UPI0033C61DA3
MPVNAPNEWSELREWLAARITLVDLTEFSHLDRVRLSRSSSALAPALDEGRDSHLAAAAVRGELERGGGAPRADDILRTYLAIALAARSAEARTRTPGGALALTDPDQLAECRALADEILTLTPHPELIAFATDLRHRVERARRWRWVEPDVWTAALVGLAVLVLPFVGGAVDDPAVTAAGVLVGASLVFGFVVAHRKRQWAVDAEAASRRGSV